MAQPNRKPEPAPETPVTARNSLVVAIEDGDGHGHYAVLAVPTFDPNNPKHLGFFIKGWKDAATRNGQSKAKAEKDKTKVPAVLAAWAAGGAADMEAPSVETVGDFILRLATAEGDNAVKTAARSGCAARIAEIKGSAASDAEIDKSLASFIAKYPSRVEAALVATLAAGYTPKPRGKGTAKSDDGTKDYGADL